MNKNINEEDSTNFHDHSKPISKINYFLTERLCAIIGQIY